MLQVLKISTGNPLPYTQVTVDNEKGKSIGQRLRLLRVTVGYKTSSALAAALKVSAPYLNNIENDIKALSPTIELGLLELIPTLNLRWLRTGEGEMFSPLGHIKSGSYTRGITFVPVEIRSTLAQNYPMALATLDTVEVYNANDKKYDEAVVFEIYADHMEPLLRNGYRVLALPVKEESWADAQPGVYVVLYRGAVAVRRLKGNALSTNETLTLWPENNDQASELVLRKADIRALWRVERIVDGKVY